MIDIHAHILPGVDDGSPDMEDSILMARLALEGGVDTIIATPHGNLSEGGDIRAQEREHTREVLEVLTEFRTELQRRSIPLRVFSGMEIFATEDAAELLKDGILLPLLEGPYCLIEFDFGDSAAVCGRRITEMLEAGWRPIIAHPERYDCVQDDPYLARRWTRMGCQLQVNRGSVLGSFGREPHTAAWELLEMDLVSYIGSDAHSPYQRTTYMQDVYDVISDAFSVRRANKLLKENAANYLLGIQEN